MYISVVTSRISRSLWHVSMRPLRAAAMAVAVLGIAGCAVTHVREVGENEISVSGMAGQFCGPEVAPRNTLKMAAVETIKRGFDLFSPLAGGNSVVSQPVYVAQANTFINSTSYHSSVTIKMYHRAEELPPAAIDARAFLGDDWQAIVDYGRTFNCL